MNNDSNWRARHGSLRARGRSLPLIIP